MTNTVQISTLSQRELEILSLIGQGLTSRVIAQKLYLSPDTVNTHRRNILRKTGAKNILSVVAMAVHQQAIVTDIAA
jgi:DNA-binding CsgD family transcriptional regulator